MTNIAKDMSGFKAICQMTQGFLKSTVAFALKNEYGKQNVTLADGFVYAKGEVPVLLVAHLDTVHKNRPVCIKFKNGRLSSPSGIGGDDRCGVFMILNIIKNHKCSVLFTEDEEIGAVGAEKFIRHECAKFTDYKYIIELDRCGSNDAVFYDCDNWDFERFITKDKVWETSYGSFSDISVIAPHLGCAAVNLSCGYYKAHSTQEYVVYNEMADNIAKVCDLIARSADVEKFEYVEAKHYYKDYYGVYDSYSKYGYKGRKLNYADVKYFDIYYINPKEEEAIYSCEADSYHEALGLFFEDNPTMTFYDIIYSDEHSAEELYDSIIR